MFIDQVINIYITKRKINKLTRSNVTTKLRYGDDVVILKNKMLQQYLKQ